LAHFTHSFSILGGEMSKRILSVMSVVMIASMTLAACGGAAAGGGTLKIVSSLPMTGSSLTQTQTIVNAEKLKLDQVGSKACGGKYTLTYEAMDDATAAAGQWDAATETENANKAAADKTVVAYLGTFNSGAAKLSIPILDNAGPLLMLSPANTYPGLTARSRPALCMIRSRPAPFTSWTTSSCTARASPTCLRRPRRPLA
jgi:branched-chain amino acid transport system substrate-binding protein